MNVAELTQSKISILDQQSILDLIEHENMGFYLNIRRSKHTRELLTKLLENGFDINRQKPLDVSGANVQYLVDHNIDPFTVKDVPQSQLKAYSGFKNSDHELLKIRKIEKIRKDHSLNPLSQEPTLLHLSILQGDYTLAKVLIELGADVNARYEKSDGRFYSPIMYQESHWQWGECSVLCTALQKKTYGDDDTQRKKDFIDYLLKQNIVIEPTVFYKSHPIIHAIYSTYIYLLPDILKKTKWYYTLENMDDWSSTTLSLLKSILKNIHNPRIYQELNSYELIKGLKIKNEHIIDE